MAIKHIGNRAVHSAKELRTIKSTNDEKYLERIDSRLACAEELNRRKNKKITSYLNLVPKDL